MILFCKYGVDPSDPSLGFVYAHYDDDKVPAGDPHPGCLVIPYTGVVEALGKYPKDPTHFAAPRLTVAVAQACKLSQFSDACGKVISGGFTSAALGAANVYPSSEEDQRNLNTALGASMVGQTVAGWTAAIKCSAAPAKAGDAPAKAVRVPHTAAQVHQALADFLAMKEAATAAYDALKGKVAEATTVDSVLALAWS